MATRELTEECIILRVVPYKEIDCIVTFFSQNRGKLSGFAFGGLKSKKRFLGTLEQFNHIVLTYQEYPGYISLKESVLKKRFSNIHKNMHMLGIAVNCLKFVEQVHKGPPDSKKVFELILDLLNLLNSDVNVPFYLPLFFKARMCCVYGYFPTLDTCFNCSKDLKDEGGVFFMSEKKMRCKLCSKSKRGGIFLSKKDIELLRFVLSSSPSSWSKIDLKEHNKAKILFFLDKFVKVNL